MYKLYECSIANQTIQACSLRDLLEQCALHGYMPDSVLVYELDENNEVTTYVLQQDDYLDLFNQLAQKWWF